jgi:polysaccharide biosynthesis/export protein
MKYLVTGLLAVATFAGTVSSSAQTLGVQARAQAGIVSGAAVTPPPGYVIGADDVLSIVFWREKDMSAEVVVRPDGLISLPLLNDIRADGLTPEQLRATLNEAARKLVEDPNVTVVVRAINSRKVFVTGNVVRPGAYPLTATMDVLQVIALAGGVTEFADSKKINVVRRESGKSLSFKFNYKDVSQGKNLQQNISLKPGDTVVVP